MDHHLGVGMQVQQLKLGHSLCFFDLRIFVLGVQNSVSKYLDGLWQLFTQGVDLVHQIITSRGGRDCKSKFGRFTVSNKQGSNVLGKMVMGRGVYACMCVCANRCTACEKRTHAVICSADLSAVLWKAISSKKWFTPCVESDTMRNGTRVRIRTRC